MKPGNDNRQARDGLDERLLDRLVDGELADHERRELLLQLEKKPDGWRRCALAFLEAQTWRQALAPVADLVWVTRPESAKDVDTPDVTPFADSGRATRQRFWHPVARLAGLATSLVIAFALGWTYHRVPVQSITSSDVKDGTRSIADRSIQEASEAAVKVARAPSAPTKPTETVAAIDPIFKNLQQRGYSIETQQRLVSMESKDGRKVKLPVQEVRIRYTGDRIY